MKVKLSRDDARMSRVSNFILLSLSFLHYSRTISGGDYKVDLHMCASTLIFFWNDPSHVIKSAISEITSF